MRTTPYRIENTLHEDRSEPGEMAVAEGSYPGLGFDPCPGDPDEAAQLASRWQDAATLLTEAALKLDRSDAEQGSWKGQAADAFRTALNTHRTRIGKLRASYERNAHTLNDWAGQLREFQQRARALERRASQAQDSLRTGKIPQVHQPAPSQAEQPKRKGYQSEVTGAQGQARQLETEYLQAAKLVAREIDRNFALPSGNSGWYGQTVDQKQESSLLAAEAHRKGGAVPVDEKERLLWWQQLSSKQQQALIQGEPADIGNANGLPAQPRSDANMLQLKQALHDAESRNDLKRADGLKKILSAMTNPQDPIHRQPMFLLGFDVKGNGHAIVSYGNPDTAKNTAVYVPGTGSSLDSIRSDIGRACTMFDSAGQESPGTTASMVWLGYDAPQWLTGPAKGRYADIGAPLLSDFVNSLPLTHQGPSHVTVIGHSYGSTVVGAALGYYGMHADDAVFVGSPGVTVNHASDLHMDPSHVWAGHMQNDIVPMLSVPTSLNSAHYFDDFSERFGTDPVSREFGGQAFASGYGQINPGGSHSDYWNAGTPSLNNMTHIVTGDYHSVTKASNMERDGNEPTSPVGDLLQAPAWGLIEGGHYMGGPVGNELQHEGQAISQVGHGIGAGIGAIMDASAGDHSATEQAGDLVDDFGGAAEDVGHMVSDPVEEVGKLL